MKRYGKTDVTLHPCYNNTVLKQAMFCEALRKDRWDFASMLWEFGIDVSEIQDQLNKVYIEVRPSLLRIQCFLFTYV